MKILKLFISLSLILSVSLINSFAAISVSDGSAFVTKAEFAADLNNLSNRMSSLENSLDAKIDSLVSSYLSRNGIWNGEKQAIINASIPTKNSQSSDNFLVGQNGILVDRNEIFLASKSGLVFLYGNTVYTDFIPNTANRDNVKYTGPAVFEMFIGKTNEDSISSCRKLNYSNFSVEALDSRNSDTMNSILPRFYVLGNNSIFLNFFVTKGDTQYYHLFLRSSVNNVALGYKEKFINIDLITIY